ncbi:MAG TPA: hypothetical protein VHG35_09170 [Gemmatimonadales bacterium]|nr:hypothetical protein [Gemmatimonadales bacterium]
MSPMSPLTPRTALRALVSLALTVVPITACDADAQRPPSTASADAEDYRLTMPVLRKALAVLYAPEAEVECAKPEDGSGDPRSMSVAEMERRMAKCPAVRRAAANQGMTLGELARAYKALTLASYRMAEEESAKLSGGRAAPLPPGALQDNLALLRENEAEIGRLTKDPE